MDRSRVHVLLCDNDPATLSLLRSCSYQVTAVKSAAQAIEALNSGGPEVDLILSDVELPREKASRMLKYIMREERLRHIPVVAISERDEMAVVAKCLRLGAVDFLVKPLRSNEVLNLWTHMWRRRRTLGLPDKHAIEGSSFSLAFNSCTSESNSHRVRAVPSQAVNTTPDLQLEMPPQLELSLRLSSDFCAQKQPEPIANSGPIESASPKEGELRASRSSAFVSYTKENKQPSEQSAIVGSNSNQLASWTGTAEDKFSDEGRDSLHEDDQEPEDHRMAAEIKNSSATENGSGDMNSQNCAGFCGGEPPLQSDSKCEGASYNGGTVHSYQQFQGFGVCNAPAETDLRNAGFNNPAMYSAQVGPPLSFPSFQYYHGCSHEGMLRSPTTMHPHAVPIFNGAFSYYPIAQFPSPQFVALPTWPGMTAGSMVGCKLTQAERREAALNKFRQKRKDRCFEKKIRYASRKKLAEQRPRVRGQFVRREAAAAVVANSSGNDRNGDGYGEEGEEEADDEQGCSELEMNSSPYSMGGRCKNG